MKFKVFISWSGERSRIFATAFGTWLGNLIQALTTFVSSEDIDKGARWASEINKEIAASGFGVICLTKDTIDRRWILFESGALSRRFGDQDDPRVATLVLDDMDLGKIPQPLAQFNSTRATKEDIFRLVKSINKAVGEDNGGVTEERLRYAFDKMWDDLEVQITRVADTPPETDKAADVKSDGDTMLDEIAAGVRELLRRQVVNPTSQRVVRLRPVVINYDAVQRVFKQLKDDAARLPDRARGLPVRVGSWNHARRRPSRAAKVCSSSWSSATRCDQREVIRPTVATIDASST